VRHPLRIGFDDRVEALVDGHGQIDTLALGRGMARLGRLRDVAAEVHPAKHRWVPVLFALG
jgi:hypothetical protein